VKLST